MKKRILLSKILSMFNLVVAGILVCGFLLFAGALSMPVALIAIVFAGSIVLHSYAAMQLQKSILHAEIPLNSQTPVGIKLMGYISLFIGLIWFVSSIMVLKNPGDFMKEMVLPPKVTAAEYLHFMEAVVSFLFVFSLSIIINVILNFRMLKWYQYSRNQKS